MMESSATGVMLLVVLAACHVPRGTVRAEEADRLRPDHWVARCPDADRVLLDAAGVEAFNRRMLARDRSLRDLAALPVALPAADVSALVAGVSRMPDGPFQHADGRAVDAADRERWLASLALDSIPADVAPRFAIVTRRAALRRFPTAQRVRRAGGPHDIDLFQESAFFPGTPTAAVHATADGRWTFVLGITYAAWIETAALAFAERDAVLDFARRSSVVVVAARALAAPIETATEAIALDMGTVLPEAGGSAASEPTVTVPVRSADGSLAVAPARIEPADAIRAAPLSASRRHVLEQAFRFLGEPYGWGHDHDARDCSGFVGEIYRSLGLLLPRNTRDQATSPALDRTAVAADWPRDRRLAEIGRLRAGDLVYAPRHVMMIVGHDESGPWVIHDTHAGRLAGAADPPANGVVVAPLARILAEDGGLTIDTITTLVRVLPRPAGDRP